METIYDKGEIIENINKIAEKIEEEEAKDYTSRDDEYIKNLMYAQFFEGLKLSIR